MLSMLSTSLRGLQAGRYLAEPPPAPPSPPPPPPEQLDFDSLLVLLTSQSGCLSRKEEVSATDASLEVTSAIMVEEEVQEEVEEVRGRLWRMLLIVSLNSRRRLVEAGKVEKEEEEEGVGSLGRWRGASCSFNVSPEEEEEEVQAGGYSQWYRGFVLVQCKTARRKSAKCMNMHKCDTIIIIIIILYFRLLC